MTVEERLTDIQRRTGISEDIIRCVLKGETDSIVDSLKRGEKATLIGRCSFEPRIARCTREDGTEGTCARVSITASSRVTTPLYELSDFLPSEPSPQEKLIASSENVLIKQIKELV